MKTKTRKPLKCGKCGHQIGVVRIKPVVRKKLLMYALLLALGMQIIAEAFVELGKWLL